MINLKNSTGFFKNSKIIRNVMGRSTNNQTKVALITGSTSGIGLGVAERFAKNGFNVVINGFGKQDQINSIVQNLKQIGAKEVLYHSADMSKETEINDMFEKIKSQFERVDILVNNAGIQHVCPVDEFPSDKWEQIIKINLISNFHTIKRSVPYMKKNGWGRIVNIASAHGLIASPFKSAYVAAKHGVLGLTKTVALELAEKNITVNAICPGYVKTPLVMNQVADTARVRGISEEDVIKKVLLLNQATKKFVEVEEIAEAVSYLCSDNAASVTGTHLSLDGGWSAQ
ncbi:3-hydroxybutyrate dehydrogenase [Brachionus plicatilis]|uniref:3-oxoacyl-[acyl-carrier-protein] reductase n=1 Tax=Brachionus plicatilis TaxID=10195 RepID=A0A3M7Q0U7_BRAPC|nr:3-hydroxybutyrate dehydrogenase [Brachionus plicatilis]